MTSLFFKNLKPDTLIHEHCLQFPNNLSNFLTSSFILHLYNHISQKSLIQQTSYTLLCTLITSNSTTTKWATEANIDSTTAAITCAQKLLTASQILIHPICLFPCSMVMLVVIAAPLLEKRRIKNSRSETVEPNTICLGASLIRNDAASDEAEYRNMSTFITMKYLRKFSGNQS